MRRCILKKTLSDTHNVNISLRIKLVDWHSTLPSWRMFVLSNPVISLEDTDPTAEIYRLNWIFARPVWLKLCVFSCWELNDKSPFAMKTDRTTCIFVSYNQTNKEISALFRPAKAMISLCSLHWLSWILAHNKMVL